MHRRLPRTKGSPWERPISSSETTNRVGAELKLATEIEEAVVVARVLPLSGLVTVFPVIVENDSRRVIVL